ncbi:MAG TPA: ATP-binding cassette domain-containing protein [Spirochaetota bacterium]|nr:ATP-binding cassette domain-containing protein [Spirochaetota bacterium]HPJ43912.1 ATP-binding cassette domain-containing protein [Spirochaetota bacterium]HPR39251.1 ATP-binding cassette domain-containing protein [Spirochaetota bacterium]HRX49244.1 ATP-binding cassette domain-containing protein [Spirochaetota bacterium]
MSSVNLRFINVSFSYNTTSENIISSLSVHFCSGWTGIAGPNGAGKTTIAKLASGILIPSGGFIAGTPRELISVYCRQETEFPPEFAKEFMNSSCNRSGELKSLLGIGSNWLERWLTLSHGERKRFQTGVSLWLEPHLLALDEPTNHLDAGARELILKALKTYRGTGLLISHDRELLDALCSNTLFIRPGSAVMRPGGISSGLEQERIEEMNREREFKLASAEFRRVRKSLNSLKQKENSRKESISKKNISRNDHDAKSRVDLARLTGKDKTASRKVKLLENRKESLKGEAESKYFKARRIDGFTCTGERFRGDRILSVPQGIITMSKERSLEIPELNILPGSRIGITGDNGTGKSTLLLHIRSLIKLPEEKVILIKQEISRDEWAVTASAINMLSGSDKGELLSVVHRLGSEPERVLETAMPSPGEIRKLILGLGLLKTPSIIMMDEPTNHMDLPSIECIEEALSGFEGALVLVSHDHRFLKKLITDEWHLSGVNGRTVLSSVLY